MLWFVLGSMCLVAVAFAIRPLLRRRPIAAAVVVFVVAASAGLYALKGAPGVPSGPGQAPDIAAMVASLAARLEQQPDDVNGWQMLGRSYMTLGNFGGAVSAYERAAELESRQNAQTLVDLGVAMAQAGGRQLSPRTVSVFENALAIEPNHPEALFWGGIAAFNRGDPELAADRWERLLENDPPAEIRTILEQRIAQWRGEPPPPPVDASPETSVIVNASIDISDGARNALPADATVYVIARDPSQPSPPIAVSRRRLSELPAIVSLSDRESMIPGRVLSMFDEFELLARVSVSGSPAAEPGDWFGSLIVTPAETADVAVTIDQRVP